MRLHRSARGWAANFQHKDAKTQRRKGGEEALHEKDAILRKVRIFLSLRLGVFVLNQVEHSSQLTKGACATKLFTACKCLQTKACVVKHLSISLP